VDNVASKREKNTKGKENGKKEEIEQHRERRKGERRKIITLE
jgi:hypothetical protein